MCITLDEEKTEKIDGDERDLRFRLSWRGENRASDYYNRSVRKEIIALERQYCLSVRSEILRCVKGERRIPVGSGTQAAN